MKNETPDKEQTFSPRRELLILMQKEPNGATRIRVEDQRDGSLLVERTAFGFEEALFARLQEAKEVSSARGGNATTDFVPQPHRHQGPVAGCAECERESQSLHLCPACGFPHDPNERG